MGKKPLYIKKWLILLGLTIVLAIINISTGSIHIPIKDILFVLIKQPINNSVWQDIILDFRLTKTLTCILAGGALALGGLQMQTLFRNPLAGPDMLGLSAGASLAVSLFFMAGTVVFGLLPSMWSLALAATLGSCSILLLVLAIANRIRDNTSLLVIGLMIGAATASTVSVLQFLSRPEEQQLYLMWTFGSMGGLNWQEILVLSLTLGIGVILFLINIKSLNAWLLGENYAQSLGVNLKRSKLLMILSTSMLAGSVTAFCGPIAFVGLAVPHLARLFFNSNNHKVLLPGVAAGGASLLLLCDILAQLPGSNYVWPINAVTALIGAPIVVWIILKGKKIYV